MEDVRLPRHVVDRLEQRWGRRSQQDAKTWSDKARQRSGHAYTEGPTIVPVMDTKMLEENLARLRAHRNNIHRYRRLLGTQLSDLERDYIHRRLEEEERLFQQLSVSTCPFALRAGSQIQGAVTHV